MRGKNRLLKAGRWAVVGFLALTTAQVQAQTPQGSLSGTVTDRESRAPLEGVRVVITGTTLETQTNASGEYRFLQIPARLLQVGVLRIGYLASSDTVRVPAGGNATKDFVMARSVTTLQELVVTGTVGNQERKAQSAQIASVSATDIKKLAVVNSVNDMLQSRVPGISVNSGSGTAGTSRNIRIRGASSISLANDPIIFIDGIRFNEGTTNPGLGGQLTDRLNDINPDDIESIEVVKGPAAATLYGADASTGVIQIITKKGRAGQSSFQQTLRAEYGQVDQNWTPPANFGNCTAANVAATSPNPLCRGQAVGTLVSDNPLERESAFRTGSDQLLGWSGRGGGANYGYFLSAGVDRTLGTLTNNDFRRYSWRSNFNWIPNSRTTLDAGVNTLRSSARLPDNDNNIYGFLGGGLLGSPLTRRDDGVPSQNGWFGFNRAVPEIEALQGQLDTQRNIINATGSFLATSWLKSRLIVGGDLINDETTRYFPKNSGGNYAGALNTGQNTQGRTGIQRYTVDFVNDANKSFGNANQIVVNATAGFQAISTRTDFLTSTGQGFTTNSSNVIGSASTTSANQTRNDLRQYGYIGNLQVAFKDRIFLSAGARIDDFSAFGSESKPITLPKVGLSWVLSDESWFSPFSSIFSSFRGRVAYGTTGRAPGAGASLTTLNSAPYAIASGAVESGAIPLNPGNSNLKPEKGTEFEAGFDASLFSDRANVEVTYFNKVSKDLILQPTLPPSLGFTQNPFANIGEVVNRGLEVGINADLLRRRNVEFSTRLNFNTLHNELTDLGSVAAFGTLNRFTEGYQLGAWVSKRIRSIDVANSRVVVADTFEVVGNAQPTFEANLSSTLTLYRNFRITASVDTKQDFIVYNNTDFFRETQLVRSDRRLDPNVLSAEERLRRYGDQTGGSRPAFVQENGAGSTVNDVRDAYLQPGDFVRFRELSFVYDVPRNRISFLRGQAMSVSLAFQNLALWSDYEGADPEVITNPNAANGVGRSDFLTLPNPKRALLRLNFSF